MKCINRVELVFSALWLSTIFLIPWFFAPEALFWKVTAITAIVAAFFHGIALGVAYWRPQRLAEETSREVREMLQDDVKNKLAFIHFVLQEVELGRLEEDVAKAQDLIAEISDHLDYLTKQSVEEWEDAYSQY